MYFTATRCFVVGLIIDFSEFFSARIDVDVGVSSLPNVVFLLNCVAVDRLRNVNSLREVLFLHVSDINVVRLFRYAPAGLNPAEIICVVANIVTETHELACASGMNFR